MKLSEKITFDVKFDLIVDSYSVLDSLKYLPMGNYCGFVESSGGTRCLKIFNICIVLGKEKVTCNQTNVLIFEIVLIRV